MTTGMTDRSDELFERAQWVIPGGVNSPVRTFRAVGGHPRFVARGDGSKLFDVDGREYIDYVQSWGALLFGHAHISHVDAPLYIFIVATAAKHNLTFIRQACV